MLELRIPDEANTHERSRTFVEEWIVAGTRIPSERSHGRRPPGITSTEIGASEEYLQWIDAQTQ